MTVHLIFCRWAVTALISFLTWGLTQEPNQSPAPANFVRLAGIRWSSLNCTVEPCLARSLVPAMAPHFAGQIQPINLHSRIAGNHLHLVEGFSGFLKSEDKLSALGFYLKRITQSLRSSWNLSRELHLRLPAIPCTWHGPSCLSSVITGGVQSPQQCC